MFFKKHALLGALFTACMAVATPSIAQTYPDQPITMVLPFPAGGVTDVVARLIAQEMQESLQQPVIVENRPGGGGQIAAHRVKSGKADGHTIFVAATEMFAINPTLYKNFSFDPIADFQPVTTLVKSPLVLVVPQDSPINSVNELIAHSKNNVQGIDYASQGIGSIGHLLGGLFIEKTGAKLVHVPYRGSSPALQDVMSGRVAMMFDPIITTSPLINGGKLKPLAIASDKRSALLPDVPTLAELGVDGVDAGVWFGIVVKKGTPEPIVERLNQEIVKAMESSKVSQRFTEQGLEPIPMTSKQFGQFLERENTQWIPLVKASGARVE